MTIDGLLNLHDQLTKTARTIMVAKNADYTNGSSDPFANFRASEVFNIPAEKALLIRVLDKIKRLETFIDQGKLVVKCESVDDSIMDIINYMILLKGLCEERKEPVKLNRLVLNEY